MSNRIDPGYVQFSIQNGTEVATLSAQDFRTAMRERDELRAESSRLAERWISKQEARLAAEAEVKRLEGLVEGRDAEIARLNEGWDETIAENERLRAALEENDRTVVGLGEASKQQRAEIERLTQDNAELSAECDQWGEKVAELWAEREKRDQEWLFIVSEPVAEKERLRAALGRLVAACEREGWDEPDADLNAAREALGHQ